MSTSFTITQLAALKAAYARGVTEVTAADGSRVRYAGLDEMARAIAAIEAEIAPAAAPVVRYAVWDRG
jgi:hypothetical protein